MTCCCDLEHIVCPVAQEQLWSQQQCRGEQEEQERQLHDLQHQLASTQAQVEQLQSSTAESHEIPEMAQSPEHGERPAAEVGQSHTDHFIIIIIIYVCIHTYVHACLSIYTLLYLFDLSQQAIFVY